MDVYWITHIAVFIFGVLSGWRWYFVANNEFKPKRRL